MTAIDREKYMDARELTTLQTVTELRAVKDLRAGRIGGVIAWAVVDVALQTGLRVSEIAKIKVGDYDPKRRALRVWRHKRRKVVQETLAISKALATHLTDFIQWKDHVGQPTGKDDVLFVGKRGPLSTRGLQRIWKAAVKRAGLPAELSIHSARHTMAVHLLRHSGNLRMVQKQLGHANPATTANMYADVTFEDMQSAMDNVFGKDNGETDTKA